MAKFCFNCGKELSENAFVCMNCGVKVDSSNEVISNEDGSLGWAILGFVVPLVGLILFLTWKKEKPKASKGAGLGALIAVCLHIFIAIVLFFELVFAVTSTISDNDNRDYNHYNNYNDYEFKFE